ncbi:uncharacterized protein LOC131933406 isoform X2 [Physella acuta]|uniref:uncharacterized protein LOC131933406 isoform X2 n=1 Tax=Physella acuta TaxID=109671 RepID=UPI0027DD1968|nr:uncharacterized protein LOC131933406 isoform X2 [Physella acuta]
MEDVKEETNTHLGNTAPATSIDDDELKVKYKRKIDEDHEEFLDQETAVEEELVENLGSTILTCSNTIKGARIGSGHSLRRHLRYLYEYNDKVMNNSAHSRSLIPNELDSKYYAEILTTNFLLIGKWELIHPKTDLCNEVLKNWFKNNNSTIYVTKKNNKIEYIRFKPDKSTEIEDFQKIAEIKLNGTHSDLFAEVEDVKVVLKKDQNIFTLLEISYENEVSDLVMFKLFYIDPLELCLSYILQTKEKKSVEHLHSPLCINCPFPEIFELCTVESIKSKLIQLKINGDLELAKNHFKRISKNVLEMSTSVTKFAFSTGMFTFTLRNISTHKVNNCISPTIEIKFKGKEDFKYDTIKFRYCDGSTPSPNGELTTSVEEQSQSE